VGRERQGKREGEEKKAKDQAKLHSEPGHCCTVMPTTPGTEDGQKKKKEVKKAKRMGGKTAKKNHKRRAGLFPQKRGVVGQTKIPQGANETRNKGEKKRGKKRQGRAPEKFFTIRQQTASAQGYQKY